MDENKELNETPAEQPSGMNVQPEQPQMNGNEAPAQNQPAQESAAPVQEFQQNAINTQAGNPAADVQQGAPAPGGQIYNPEFNGQPAPQAPVKNKKKKLAVIISVAAAILAVWAVVMVFVIGLIGKASLSKKLQGTWYQESSSGYTKVLEIDSNTIDYSATLLWFNTSIGTLDWSAKNGHTITVTTHTDAGDVTTEHKVTVDRNGSVVFSPALTSDGESEIWFSPEVYESSYESSYID